MLSIKDVPNQVMEEGEEMLAIPNGLDQGVTQIIQQWKKDEHDQKTNVDSVQILERMVRAGKTK